MLNNFFEAPIAKHIVLVGGPQSALTYELRTHLAQPSHMNYILIWLSPRIWITYSFGSALAYELCTHLAQPTTTHTIEWEALQQKNPKHSLCIIVHITIDPPQAHHLPQTTTSFLVFGLEILHIQHLPRNIGLVDLKGNFMDSFKAFSSSLRLCCFCCPSNTSLTPFWVCNPSGIQVIFTLNLST